MQSNGSQRALDGEAWVLGTWMIGGFETFAGGSFFIHKF